MDHFFLLVFVYFFSLFRRFAVDVLIQSTPDNSNLQGKLKKFELSGLRVIGR